MELTEGGGVIERERRVRLLVQIHLQKLILQSTRSLARTLLCNKDTFS